MIKSLPERVLQQVVNGTAIYHDSSLMPNFTATESRDKRQLLQTSHHVVFKKRSRDIEDTLGDYGKDF